jgi:hypothetical protein
MHRAARRQRGGQRGVIGVAQVAAEPDEDGFVLGHDGNGQIVEVANYMKSQRRLHGSYFPAGQETQAFAERAGVFL